jgi:hypothetical protein
MEIRAQLAKPINLEKGFDPDTELKDALEFLTDRFNLQFIVHSKDFEDDLQVKEVERQHVGLPKMNGVPLFKILLLLLAQVNGDYVIRSGRIEITTPLRTHAGIFLPSSRHTTPKVETALSNQPLAFALRELSDASGVNVVLDSKHVSDEQAKSLITARFSNVAVDTAVRIVANMADLKAIVVDNVIYVTTEARADKFKGDFPPLHIDNGPPKGAK